VFALRQVIYQYLDTGTAFLLINPQLDNLSERTGSASFTFVTRGHINDTTTPAFIESDGALAFFNQVLGLDPSEVAGRFELWATSRTRGGFPGCPRSSPYNLTSRPFSTVHNEPDTLVSMCAESTKMISDSLRKSNIISGAHRGLMTCL